jgi:uncharacterized membrane protein
MIEIKELYRVDCPVEEVFALISDPARDPDWQEMVKDVRMDGLEPVGPGSTYTITFAFMGRRMHFHSRVARYEPPRRYAYESVQGPFGYRGEYMLDRAEGADGAEVAVVTLSLELEPRGFFGIVPEALLVQIFRKQLRRSIATKRQLLEASIPVPVLA